MPAVLAAAASAPGRLLLEFRQHLFLASSLGLSLVWLFGVTVKNAIIFHPILMTATTMVLGWSPGAGGGLSRAYFIVIISNCIALGLGRLGLGLFSVASNHSAAGLLFKCASARHMDLDSDWYCESLAF